jgi:HSP20 family molecular chaperone IbpA
MTLIKKTWPINRPHVFEGDIFKKMFDILDDGHVSKIWSSDPYNVYTDKQGNTILEFAIVGAEKEDISVVVSGQTLKIEAITPKIFDKEENTEFYQKKIAQRSLKKRYTLHESVDADSIKSSYKNGLLKVEIPLKKEEARDVIVEVH